MTLVTDEPLFALFGFCGVQIETHPCSSIRQERRGRFCFCFNNCKDKLEGRATTSPSLSQQLPQQANQLLFADDSTAAWGLPALVPRSKNPGRAQASSTLVRPLDPCALHSLLEGATDRLRKAAFGPQAGPGRAGKEHRADRVQLAQASPERWRCAFHGGDTPGHRWPGKFSVALLKQIGNRWTRAHGCSLIKLP